MQNKHLIIYVTIVLVIINIIGVNQFDLHGIRVIRLISSSILFLCFVGLKGYRKKLLLLAFIGFVFSDIFMLFYENNVFKSLNYLAISFSFICISLNFLSLKKKLEINKYIGLVYAILLVVNIYLFTSLIKIINLEIFDTWSHIFFYIYSFSLAIMTLIVTNYNLQSNNKKSRLGVAFVFLNIISVISSALAYYNPSTNYLFYLNRTSYVIGLGLLLIYSIFPFRKNKLIFFK